MKSALAILLLFVLAGCGKKSEAGSPGGVEVTAWGNKPVDTKKAKAQLEELLPPGPTKIYVSPSDPLPFLRYGVEYSRPGFGTRNVVDFDVVRENDDVTVKATMLPPVPNGTSIDLGEWKYQAGKLRSEKALEATESQWAWLQQRSQEVAAATYKFRK